MAGALDRRSLVVLQPKLLGIEMQARRINGWFTEFSNKARDVNRAVVDQMAKVAGDRVDQRPGPTVRPRDLRTGRLKAAIENPASHIATVDGFVFMDYDAMYQQVIYWRLIEEGTHRFVGQVRPFIFLSGKSGRPVKPRAGRRGQDTVILGKRGTPLLRIGTPIEPHEYGAYAVQQFTRDNYAAYKARIRQAAALAGLPLVIS